MFKQKPLRIVLLGLTIALIAWGGSQLFQTGKTRQSKPQNPLPSLIENAVVDVDLASASIQTAIMIGGRLIISGTGVSGSNVELKHSFIAEKNDAPIANTAVNDKGRWTLSYIPKEGEENLALVIVSDIGKQVMISDETLFVIKLEAPAVDSEMEIDEIIEPNPVPVLIVLSAPGSQSRVLQPPFGHLPALGGFSLEAIDYDNSGGVIFSGSSSQRGRVVILIEGRQLDAGTQIDQSGRWNLIYGNILPVGAYQLIAELLPENGQEVKTITFPFERSAPLTRKQGSPKLVVEKSDTHTKISQALHGGGFQYTVIYLPTVLTD